MWETFLKDSSLSFQGFESPVFVWVDIGMKQYEYLAAVGHVWCAYYSGERVRLIVCERDMLTLIAIVLEGDEYIATRSPDEVKELFDSFMETSDYNWPSFIWWLALCGYTEMSPERDSLIRALISTAQMCPKVNRL